MTCNDDVYDCTILLLANGFGAFSNGPSLQDDPVAFVIRAPSSIPRISRLRKMYPCENVIRY